MESSVVLAGSKYVVTSALAKTCLSWAKELSCLLVHPQQMGDSCISLDESGTAVGHA